LPEQLQIRQLLAKPLNSGLTLVHVCQEHPAVLLEMREKWEWLRGVEDRFPLSK
jgi:hypothetical protein